jgi:poly-gamma-glutamate synthesis protein (capsule biosynthesis protein)
VDEMWGLFMHIRIALGGDVNFSKDRGQMAYLVHRKKASLLVRYWRRLIKELSLWPVLGDSPPGEIRNILLKEYGGIWENPLPEINEYYDNSIPFMKIGEFFRDADIGYVNLETPLAKSGRHIGSFCSSPGFARVLRENNINIVSIANNHSFDAGERGFIETLDVLKGNTIKFVGGGMNIEEARQGEIIRIGRLKLGFLGYTALCNSFFMSLAKDDQPGILPLFEPIVLHDIRVIKKKCDFLIVAPHFDIENTSKIHKKSIAMTHKMVDQGADLIIGCHSHVPKPIEVYNGKLIIYSLGNLIFSFWSKTWGNNLVAEVILSNSGKYEDAKFYPIYSDNNNCFSPYIIENKEGDKFLSQIRRNSQKIFKTPLLLDQHFLEIQDFNA